jgi:hypothetical protein
MIAKTNNPRTMAISIVIVVKCFVR